MTKAPCWNEIFPEFKSTWQYAYKATLEHYAVLLPTSLLYGLSLFAGDISSFLVDKKSDAYFMVALAGAILSMAFNIGIARMGFQLEEKKPVSTLMLFGYGRFILPLIALNLILGGPLFIIGLWVLSVAPYFFPLAVVAGVYFFVRLGLFSYFLAIAPPATGKFLASFGALYLSLRQSFHATHGWFIFLLLLMIAEFALLILGALLLGIGLIWAVPFTLFANTHVFRRISERSLVK